MSIDYIISRIKKKDDISSIEKAFNFANEKLSGLNYINGESLINHVLGVANTLIDFNADTSTIISSLLYETINNGVSKEEIGEKFDSTIANIALETSKFSNLEITENIENRARYLNELKAESPEDVRTLFIKLAEQLYNMQTMKSLSVERQRKVASETLNVLVPTAHRLGLNYIKSKLEDLCLYYLHPEAYNDILKRLNASPSMLNMHLNSMKENISKILTENNIRFIIKGRVKNIYSIYTKLLNGKSWEDIYDILALRILVETESECNKVAELIHTKYIQIPSRFKDYITTPKENMYQSLHTTIIGEGGRYYEIQIRTRKMNKTAEKGTASHRLYKERKLKRSEG